MCDALSSLRRLALLLLLVISTENALAQLTLGYCDEEGYTSSLTNSSTESTISCAMGLTPALQADYTFCSISYLRILLTAPENLTSFKVWLRKDLNDVAYVRFAAVYRKFTDVGTFMNELKKLVDEKM